jgi:hypothetical protein
VSMALWVMGLADIARHVIGWHHILKRQGFAMRDDDVGGDIGEA